MMLYWSVSRRYMVWKAITCGLEKIFGGIQMENLHKVLWEVYQESTGGIDFLEKADIILKPYYREISSSEQNACV